MTVLQTITVLASAARTATGTADIGDAVASFDTVDVFIDVTAVSGTSPTMTVTYQSSVDGGTTWFDGVASTAITATGRQVLSITSKVGSRARLSYVIGGTTPSFTFSAIAQMRRSGD